MKKKLLLLIGLSICNISIPSDAEEQLPQEEVARKKKADKARAKRQRQKANRKARKAAEQKKSEYLQQVQKEKKRAMGLFEEATRTIVKNLLQLGYTPGKIQPLINEAITHAAARSIESIKNYKARVMKTQEAVNLFTPEQLKGNFSDLSDKDIVNYVTFHYLSVNYTFDEENDLFRAKDEENMGYVFNRKSNKYVPCEDIGAYIEGLTAPSGGGGGGGGK